MSSESDKPSDLILQFDKLWNRLAYDIWHFSMDKVALGSFIYQKKTHDVMAPIVIQAIKNSHLS